GSAADSASLGANATALQVRSVAAVQEIDVLGSGSQVDQSQFTVGNGTQFKTFEVVVSLPGQPQPGVNYIQVLANDSATAVAGKIAKAVTAAFSSASVQGAQVTFSFSSGSVTASATAPDLGVLNVTATPEQNQVQLQGVLSLNLNNLANWSFNQSTDRTLVSRNDDYFGTDSFINMSLAPGVYYVAVSSSGNSQFDPNIPGSGWGGKSDGAYELRLNFQADTATYNTLTSFVDTPGHGLNQLKQDSPQPLDGNADGTPGGTYNFWFNVGPTIYVDTPGATTTHVNAIQPASASVNAAGQVQLTNTPGPLSSSVPLQTALSTATVGENIRIEGNGGVQLGVAINQSPPAVQSPPVTPPPTNPAIIAGQTFALSAGSASSTFEFFQLGGDLLEVTTGGLASLDGKTFSITQGGTTTTYEFADNHPLQSGDGNTPIVYQTSDTVATLASKIAAALGKGAPIQVADGNYAISMGGNAATSYNLNGIATLLLRRGGTGSVYALPTTGPGAIEVTAGGSNGLDGSTFTITQGSATVTFDFALNGRVVSGDHYAVPFDLNGVTDSTATLATEIAQAINDAITSGAFGTGTVPITASYNAAIQNGSHAYPVITLGGDANTKVDVTGSAATLKQIGGSQAASAVTVSPVVAGAGLIEFTPAGQATFAQAIANQMASAIDASPLVQVPAGVSPPTVTVTNDANYYYVDLAEGQFRLVVNPQTTPFDPALGANAAPALYTDTAYQIGTNTDTSIPSTLPDGATFNVPQGVTVMMDPGAEFKMFHSVIDVGSSSQNVNRSEAALQTLGIPGNQVIFTSFNDGTVGGQLSQPVTAPRAGDWGGLVFRNDSDLEPLGIFLNYVDETTLRYGGGTVSTVNGTNQNYSPIDVQTARPTISNDVIVDSPGAPISATPNSFQETQFGQDITLTAPAGSAINDGQTFSIHGQTFEFDNLNSPATLGVLPGNVAISYYGTAINNPNPHTPDAAAQVAQDIAAAIRGAQLTAPLVQAAVTGSQVTIT
ncbi:MAG: beta strand repeat-containing protein, partial [Pirellulales bacterium]